LTSKKPAVVIAIANSVNGNIFARSCDKSSLTYDVTRTAATRAADIKRMMCTSKPFANIRVNIDNIANQKNVKIGRRTTYSITKKNAANILTAAG
jgi:hypothetical protein